MKRNKAILCAVASFGLITAANTINANAMTMRTTTSSVETATNTASYVKGLIDNLPYTITFDNINKVKEARYAYNALGKIEKDKIYYYTLETLESAEKRVKDFEAQEIKAQKLVERIEKLKATVNYDKNDQYMDTINKVNLKANKDEIQDIRNNYEGLNYYIQKEFKKLNSYKDFSRIECKLTEVAWM